MLADTLYFEKLEQTNGFSSATAHEIPNEWWLMTISSDLRGFSKGESSRQANDDCPLCKQPAFQTHAIGEEDA